LASNRKEKEIEMPKSTSTAACITLWFLFLLAGALPALAEPMCPAGKNESEIPCVPIQYHGGLFLQGFTIYPVYMGQWTQAEIDTQQAFLTNLTEYISGKNAPAGDKTMLPVD
jgi:hypothetical protein